MAIDTSLSMKATDVAPTRLRAAQAAAKQFVNLLPPAAQRGPGHLDGREPRSGLTPAQDRESLLAAIDNLRLSERTAIGEAIYACSTP